MTKSDSKFTVGSYLVTRLKQLGVNQMFIVAGDYLFNFLDCALENDLELICCCNELNAGYAADGYARVNGLSAVGLAFSVGEFSAINAIAGAYCEHVPVVVIGGSPALKYHHKPKHIHHSIETDYLAAMKMYEEITVDCQFISDPQQAPKQIDQALQACLYHKRPVYISLPTDIIYHTCEAPGPFELSPANSHRETLVQAVEKAYQLLTKAKNPVIIGGPYLMSYLLKEDYKDLVENSGFLCASLFSAKGIISEQHPQYMGIYQGKWGDPAICKIVEEADAVLLMGSNLNETDMGGFTAALSHDIMIEAKTDQVLIQHHKHTPVHINDFIKNLSKKFGETKNQSKKTIKKHFEYTPGQKMDKGRQVPMTTQFFFKKLAHFLRPDDIVVVDTGCAIFCCSQMQLPPDVLYIGQADYMSIGYGTPALLGVCTAAPNRRTILLVGDGAFQETAQELSTIMRYNCKPIIFLLNNDGYTTERVIREAIYNDLQPWKYHQLPAVFGDNFWSCEVKQESDLEEALTRAEASQELSFIEIHLDRLDCGPMLQQLGETIKAARSKTPMALG